MTTDRPPPEDDPLVTMYVERSLDLIRDSADPEELEAMRAMLYILYENDPETVDLLDRIRAAKQEPPIVGESGERLRSDKSDLAQTVARKLVGGGGR